ncbi:hypothetical protein UFOVP1221_8 [uncultured Caudovirales phage]|uniref:Uncharacterized protein n=1 Tax=uncultured Caudovirales phage TaxID=2100421 RepID=A0A6J5MGP1_9CAUD|nr:hypothetical protein UFOVP491_19 [uncultured Caudovirales phage]CAB4191103.1 hypothetical protein UFOVP1221_8 [uncultured Caudovirales phage]
MAADQVAYDKTELRAVIRAFKAMDDESVQAAKTQSGALATYLQRKIMDKAGQAHNQVASKIAEGSRVSKSSKIGEISFGFASQRLSGGGTTQQLWGGYEFGSNRYKQFPVWSGREGRGSKGWFIYPTLRAEQPYLIREWENGFDNILKEWDR